MAFILRVARMFARFAEAIPQRKPPASASAAPDACGGDRISPVRRRALRAQFRRQTIGSKKKKKKSCAFYAENHVLVFIVYLLAVQKKHNDKNNIVSYE